MEGVTQTTFYDPNDPNLGNCLEACFATLLGLTIDDIRVLRQSGDSVQAIWEKIDDYLTTIGKELIIRPASFVPEGLYIASGPSSRGLSHAVVYRDGKLIWDPHPSREGILMIDHVYVLTELEKNR